MTGYLHRDDIPKKIDALREMQNRTYSEARKNVEDWYEFSMNPRTEAEIREQLKKDRDAEPGKELCCITYICANSKLSEKFIEELVKLTKISGNKKTGIKSKVDWDAISMYQDLSESFIHKHADDVNWTHILMYQDITPEFKEAHKNYITLQEQGLDLNTLKKIRRK